MTWSYMVVFNDRLGKRQEVLDLVDATSEISYWYSCLPHCVFLTSTLTANEIAEKFFEKFGREQGNRFLVMEVHKDRQGWLPKKAWHLFRNPKEPRLDE